MKIAYFFQKHKSWTLQIWFHSTCKILSHVRFLYFIFCTKGGLRCLFQFLPGDVIKFHLKSQVYNILVNQTCPCAENCHTYTMYLRQQKILHRKMTYGRARQTTKNCLLFEPLPGVQHPVSLYFSHFFGATQGIQFIAYLCITCRLGSRTIVFVL